MSVLDKFTVIDLIKTRSASVATIDTSEMSSASQQQAQQGLDQVRYGLIMVSTVPPLIAYFIVQKSFKGGVMVGSVKG